MNTTVATPTTAIALPAIGEAFSGGIFAGITLHDDKPHALVLLPDVARDINHADATAWAEGIGGVLPSRIDAIVLFKNVRAQVETGDYYWTSEENPVNADSAFFQSFTNGNQGCAHKDFVYRARAVRRVPL